MSQYQRPPLLISPAGCQTGPTPDRWLVTWRLQNSSQEPFQILATRLPHGRFRAEEQVLDPTLQLAPGASDFLERWVACREPPGTIVENAFLILRLLWQDRPWRAFARMRVMFDANGVPHPACEAVDIHPVGFSRTRSAAAEECVQDARRRGRGTRPGREAPRSRNASTSQ